MLLVSHDRALLDAVGTRTVAFEDGRLRSYEGGWAEYARVREERREAEAQRRPRAAKQERRAAAKPRQRARRRGAGPSKNARAPHRASWSARSSGPRPRCAALEDELADPAHVEQPDARERAASATRRRSARSRQAYAAWEEATGREARRPLRTSPERAAAGHTARS